MIQGLENQTGVHEILRLFFVLVRLHEIGRKGFEGDLEFLLFALAPDFQLQFVADKFPLHDLGHVGLFAIDVDGAGAIHVVAIQLQQHVTDFQNFSAGAGAVHRSEHHPGVIVRKIQGLALGRVENGIVLDGQFSVVIVLSVFHVLQEAADDWRRNHVAGVLGHIPAVALKGYSYHFHPLDDRAAGIPWINGCIYLDGKVLIHAAVAVFLVVHPADHSAGDGDALAPDGVAHHFHGGVQFGNFRADGKRDRLVERGTGFLEFEQSEVAIMSDVFDPGPVRGGITDFLDSNAAGIADDVGIGHEEIRPDEESGASAAGRSGGIPRCPVVHPQGRTLYIDNAFILFAQGAGFFIRSVLRLHGKWGKEGCKTHQQSWLQGSSVKHGGNTGVIKKLGSPG